MECPECKKETNSNSWISIYGCCYKCKEKKDYESEKRDAIKNKGTSSENYILCPYCGSNYGTDEMHESQNVECFECEKDFHVDIEYNATYTTSEHD